MYRTTCVRRSSIEYGEKCLSAFWDTGLRNGTTAARDSVTPVGYVVRRTTSAVNSRRGYSSSTGKDGRLELKSSTNDENSTNIATTSDPQSSPSHAASASASPFDDGDTGYLKRRLEQLAFDAAPIRDDPRAGKNLDSAAPVSDLELKDLQSRLEGQTFKHDNAQAIAGANLPASASKHTRDIAFTQPWTGTESTGDAVLRMLVDVNKPLRIPGSAGKFRPPQPSPPGGAGGRAGSGGPGTLQMPQKERALPNSVRLARARELTLEYTISKNTAVRKSTTPIPKEEEKQGIEDDPKFSQLYRERFRTPRAMPGTLQGLRALADERIEEARARGQFNNIKRGGKLDMDARISSPFLDTTEFFLNRIIQKQDITPPWIDKQATIRQELHHFRSAIRESWKRQAMRWIAVERQGLEQQVILARKYAVSELAEAKRLGLLKEMAEERAEDKAQEMELSAAILTAAGQQQLPDQSPDPAALAQIKTVIKSDSTEASASTADSAESDTAEITPLPPLPKHEWEEIERKYHELSIKTLNDNIRSYNLMAPSPARRSYLHLSRELAMCYADVAPLIEQGLRDRDAMIKSGRTLFDKAAAANTPGTKVSNIFGEHMVVMEKRGGEYGLKEMFKEFFSRKNKRTSA
ncbi:uncharacterized protein V1518DRAFT_419651 [Limtongia smithiae]|uniref:uncharacterized protein n=1 Tax=Limtongia smithiae TaxID=1125753 RepID=UPI0034CF8BF1